MRPYIGITGFVSSDEVEMAWNIFQQKEGWEKFRHCYYMLMVGVLVSLKTLYGNKNKWPNRYPETGNIAGIFFQHQQMLNLVHYSSKKTDTLFIQLMALTELIRPKFFSGFQLNIPWPPELEVLAYKLRYPDKTIILQIGKDALETVENFPERLVERLNMYTGVVDYILLDLSGGKGELLNPDELRDYIHAIRLHPDSAMKNVGIGIAGGLSSYTLDVIKPLAKEFSYLSIDAEGRLRNENDHLDMNLVEGYISEALKVLI